MTNDPTLVIFLVVVFILILIVMHLVQLRRIASLRSTMDERARAQYEQWRQSDYESLVDQISSVAQKEAQTELNRWKIDLEAEIRQDAISRSRAVITGKVAEYFVPYMPGVFPYNPKDARFVGGPIAFVVFDGHDEGDIRRVIFLEVKTGSSALTKAQRQVKNAVQECRVEWQLVHLG